MSENLFSIQSLGQTLCLCFIFTLLLAFGMDILYLIISRIFENKKSKVEENIRNIERDDLEKISNLRIEMYHSENERKNEILNEIDEIEDNKKVKVEELNNEVKKYDKKINSIEWINTVKYFFTGSWIFLMIITFFVETFLGGSFSNLHKVDYEDMNLQVTAYYEVKYDGVDQRTLTVFVKNNSEKSLRSAIVRQKGTNNEAVVRNIDSGQEKIVTIETYQSGEYEFVLESIEFIE